jgi:hypothetical protein
MTIRDETTDTRNDEAKEEETQEEEQQEQALQQDGKLDEEEATIVVENENEDNIVSVNIGYGTGTGYAGEEEGTPSWQERMSTVSLSSEPEIEVPPMESDGDAIIYDVEGQVQVLVATTTTTTTTGSSSSELQLVSSFPVPFYCPITKQVMQDPVVTPDGISYERSALLLLSSGRSTIEEYDPAVEVYPNRALRAIIMEPQNNNQDDDFDNEEMEMDDGSIRSGMMRLQTSMTNLLSQVLDKSVLGTTNTTTTTTNTTTGESSSAPPSEQPQPQQIIHHSPLPEVYFCPITFNIIHDPVIDPEGNTFERVAVENWVRLNGNSPITRTLCRPEQLRPNRAIRDLLELEAQKPRSKMHPTIRTWKEEPPPLATDPELGGNAILDANNNNNAAGDMTMYNNNNNNNNNPALTNNNSPEAELLAERRARARCAFSLVSMFFTLLFFVLFFRYGGFGLLFLGILCCNYACRFGGGEQQQQQP